MAKKLPIITGSGENLPAPFLDKTIIVTKSETGMDIHYDEQGNRYSLFRFPDGFTAYQGLGEIESGTNLGGKTVLEVLMQAIGWNISIRLTVGLNISFVSGEGDYKKGDPVTISAASSKNVVFDGWVDDITGKIASTENPWTFIASKNRRLTATGHFSGTIG
jgi:hypothetical protein